MELGENDPPPEMLKIRVVYPTDPVSSSSSTSDTDSSDEEGQPVAQGPKPDTEAAGRTAANGIASNGQNGTHEEEERSSSSISYSTSSSEPEDGGAGGRPHDRQQGSTASMRNGNHVTANREVSSRPKPVERSISHSTSQNETHVHRRQPSGHENGRGHSRHSTSSYSGGTDSYDERDPKHERYSDVKPKRQPDRTVQRYERKSRSGSPHERKRSAQPPRRYQYPQQKFYRPYGPGPGRYNGGPYYDYNRWRPGGPNRFHERMDRPQGGWNRNYFQPRYHNPSHPMQYQRRNNNDQRGYNNKIYVNPSFARNRSDSPGHRSPRCWKHQSPPFDGRRDDFGRVRSDHHRRSNSTHRSRSREIEPKGSRSRSPSNDRANPSHQSIRHSHSRSPAQKKRRSASSRSSSSSSESGESEHQNRYRGGRKRGLPSRFILPGSYHKQKGKGKIAHQVSLLNNMIDLIESAYDRCLDEKRTERDRVEEAADDFVELAHQVKDRQRELVAADREWHYVRETQESCLVASTSSEKVYLGCGK